MGRTRLLPRPRPSRWSSLRLACASLPAQSRLTSSSGRRSGAPCYACCSAAV